MPPNNTRKRKSDGASLADEASTPKRVRKLDSLVAEVLCFYFLFFDFLLLFSRFGGEMDRRVRPGRARHARAPNKWPIIDRRPLTIHHLIPCYTLFPFLPQNSPPRLPPDNHY